MNKINFVNLPSTTTPVNATNLNQLQTNVDEGKIDRSLSAGNITDANNLITTGFYYLGGASSNLPVSGYSVYVQVYKYSDNYVLQIATRAATAAGYIQHTRQKYNGTWTDWKDSSFYSGTWTPTINTRENVAPTLTYTTQKGSYQKFGNMIFISFYCVGKITAINGTNNYAVVKGLPFVPKAYSLGECAISTGIISNLAASNGGILAISNAYNGEIYCQNTTGTTALVLKTSGDSNFIIAGSGWYEAAS